MPEDRQRKINERNWLLIFHLISIVALVGGNFTQGLLLISTLTAKTSEVLKVSHHLMHIVDIGLIIPGALAVLITGILLAFRTHWGFFKHYWIMAKEAIFLIVIIIGSTLNIWVQDSIRITAEKGLDALHDPNYLQDRTILVGFAIIQTSLFLSIIVISVLKPWGKRKKGMETNRRPEQI